MLSHWLAQFPRWRRWRGGIWFNVTPRLLFPYTHFWQRESPIDWLEHVNCVEIDGRDATLAYREHVEAGCASAG